MNTFIRIIIIINITITDNIRHRKSVADLEGGPSRLRPPPPLWATDRRRHCAPDKWQRYFSIYFVSFDMWFSWQNNKSSSSSWRRWISTAIPPCRSCALVSAATRASDPERPSTSFKRNDRHPHTTNHPHSTNHPHTTIYPHSSPALVLCEKRRLNSDTAATGCCRFIYISRSRNNVQFARAKMRKH